MGLLRLQMRWGRIHAVPIVVNLFLRGYVTMARIGKPLVIENRGQDCQWPLAIAVWLPPCPELT